MKNDNLYGNIWVFKVEGKGDKAVKGHSHEFDHLHYVVKGSALLTCLALDNKTVLYEIEMKKDNWYMIPKNHIHKIKFIKDYKGHCIHALRDTDNNVTETNFIEDIKNNNYNPQWITAKEENE